MRKFWDSVKIKILLGYFSLAGIAAFTVWLIYSEINVYTDNESRMTRLNNKILYFTSVLTNLYQAEALERSYSQTGSPVHYRNYEKVMDEVFLQFDTLSQLSDNPAEKIHNDSILDLLTKKRDNLKELNLLKKSNSEDLYARAMDRFNINKDSINSLLNIRTIITDKSESTFVEQKKRNFFDRLRYAFNPKESLDSIVQVNKQQIVQTDTIINNINPADSVIHFLTTIMQDIKKENETSELQLARKQKEILANDRTITLQLRHMLSMFEKDIFINSLQELNTMQERIRLTTWYLISLGILALIVIISFIVLILKDITQSQRYRLELEMAKSYSDSLLKSKEQIMLSITHDIKSPIASVMGYARLMNETDNKEKRESYLAFINKSGDHILKLVTDLVDLTRLETGKLKFEYSGFNLFELVNDTCSSFFPVASAKNLDFRLNFDIPRENEYFSDPVRIKQILGNIISNAIKYTHRGSVDVSVNRARIDSKSERIIFQVTDTGIGISEEHSRIIFNEFTRISDKYDGAGLGLSIARRIVTLLNGQITLKSQPGEGSLFTINIPLLMYTDELRLPSKTTGTGTSQKRVLLIDDDPVFLNMTAELLVKSGLQVDKCTSAMDAVGSAESFKPDIIITDLQMPAMNGMDVLSYLQRKTGRMLPVILLTGIDSPDTGDALFSAILKKTVTSDELISTINSLLNKNSVSDFDKGRGTEIYRYNLDQIRQFALDDNESLQRILLSFAESSYENLILFDKYIKQHDRKSLSELAHKMMAMFRQLEAGKIVEMLKKIEIEYHSMTDEQWVQLAKEALNSTGHFINAFCEDQGIVV